MNDEKTDRRFKYATADEARDAKRARNRVASKNRKAAKAIAEGREPGRVGGPIRYLSEEERRSADKETQRRWREKNLEYVRQRDAEIKRKERREKAAAQGRKLQKVGGDSKYTAEQRRENSRASSLNYARANPEFTKFLSDRYYAEHKDECLVRSRNRRARKAAADGVHSKKDIDLLWELQRGKCVFCLKPLKRNAFEIDHHIPLALGGSNDRGNLRLLHRKCNREKAAREPAYHANKNGLLCW